ncbi:riboflavin synthase [Novosphingobium sp. Fuku2-ISO-50]|uniref:riboflavin synthase n=1 Tax=Novosphingobium sp. Fuku2-ISO-50 TaxID=1739114 RepID=UPI00076BDE74|nr:riboflavin synthase [Novosphingobium sp. Fuku2-ISO-50]KUR78514.1 riboflavin synthase subunit alpha [Novosphingobium sp. Fuku2-ISO-50]
MFTGIIVEVGKVLAIDVAGDHRVTISTTRAQGAIAIGASIACSGVCLTVVEKGTGFGGEAGTGWFAVDVSGETISRTVPAQWQVGARLNLEPALKLGDELGGHIVTGHVDGVGEVASITPEGASRRIEFLAPADLAPYIAAKGSITIDGVSLTVNSVADEADGRARFGVNIIPHTAEVTTLGALVPGAAVNLEIDVLARYLMRMQSATRTA